jgi:hypothetical protein
MPLPCQCRGEPSTSRSVHGAATGSTKRLDSPSLGSASLSSIKSGFDKTVGSDPKQAEPSVPLLEIDSLVCMVYARFSVPDCHPTSLHWQPEQILQIFVSLDASGGKRSNIFAILLLRSFSFVFSLRSFLILHSDTKAFDIPNFAASETHVVAGKSTR